MGMGVPFIVFSIVSLFLILGISKLEEYQSKGRRRVYRYRYVSHASRNAGGQHWED